MFNSFGAVNAKGQDEREPLENGLFEIGYKTVEEAVNEMKIFSTGILYCRIKYLQFNSHITLEDVTKILGLTMTLKLCLLMKIRHRTTILLD